MNNLCIERPACRTVRLSAVAQVLLMVSLVFIVAACKPAAPTDTGYTGTWSRGNDWVTSTIFIRQVDGIYEFRWQKDAADGSSSVECQWDGRCQEYVNGEQTSEFAFATWFDEETGHLMVQCKGKVWKPEELLVDYTDELVVEDGGLNLVSYTLESNGQQFEGDYRPKRILEKISDAVADPPPVR